MASKRIAQTGVVLFALVLVPSIAVVVRGSIYPSFYRPITRGDMLPLVAMTDTTGQVVNLRAHRDSHLMLVSVPSLDLTAAQRDWITRLSARVEALVPVSTVVVTSEMNPTVSAAKVCPAASSLLVDEGRSLVPFLNGSDKGAVVCIIDRGGQLVFRTRVPNPAEAATQVTELSAADLREITGSTRVIANR